MRRWILSGFFTVLFVSLVTLYSNCSRPPVPNTGITIATNPMNPVVSEKLLAGVCGTINRCHPDVTFDQCRAGFSVTDGLDALFALPYNYSSFAQIAQAERVGLLTGSAQIAEACFSSIDHLDCSDARVTAAYNKAALQPYLASPLLIGVQACENLYTAQESSTCSAPEIIDYVVNDSGDESDQKPGDHICATATGKCTLRAALVESNAVSSQSHRIRLPSGTIKLGSALTIASSVSLYGDCSGGTILDGQSIDSLVNVKAEQLEIEMHDLKLQNGLSANASGGAIDGGYNDGAIFRGTHLTFFNNRATGPNGGGAVVWTGHGSSFSCTECIFDSNQANGTNGGAILFKSNANLLQRCLFVNNTSGAGGAVFDAGAGTTFINNTFYKNNGGGIYLNTPGASYVFNNNTFVENAGEGIGSSTNVTAVYLSNNLFYNNTSSRGNCDIPILVSQGGNLSFPASSFCTFNHESDVIAQPLLGPLKNNGGFSPTLELLTGSPGINQGVTTGCPAVDQRNHLRSTQDRCDIGAFEKAP